MEEFISAYSLLPAGFLQIEGGVLKRCTCGGGSEYAVRIPDGVTEIGGVTEYGFNVGAFESCTGLREVYIPGSVTAIGERVFSGCTALTQVIIPGSVTDIGARAFSGCTALTQVAIPGSVTAIGEAAFSGCTALTQVAIPEGVTDIGDAAFHGCTALTQVAIPEGVIGIRRSAFSDCTALTQAAIPGSVTAIGAGAFSGCTALTQVAIAEGVTAIGASAFSGCTALTQVVIPDGVTVIGPYAFYGCDNLREVRIPDTVPEIGKDAFSSWGDDGNGWLPKLPAAAKKQLAKLGYPGPAAPTPMDEKRKKVEIISNLIRDLTFEQTMQFAVSCVNRIKCFTKSFLSVNLAKYFNSLADIISKPKLERKIYAIINDLNNYPIENFDWEKHRYFFLQFNSFGLAFSRSIDAVETLEDIENDIVSYFSHIFVSILNYIDRNDDWDIRSYSEALISIAEANYKLSKFEKHTENQYEEIKELIDSESKKQITMIKLIKEGNQKLLCEYIEENKFEYKGRPGSM